MSVIPDDTTPQGNRRTYLPSVPSVFLGPETFPFRYVTLRYNASKVFSFSFSSWEEKSSIPRYGMDGEGWCVTLTRRFFSALWEKIIVIVGRYIR